MLGLNLVVNNAIAVLHQRRVPRPKTKGIAYRCSKAVMIQNQIFIRSCLNFFKVCLCHLGQKNTYGVVTCYRRRFFSVCASELQLVKAKTAIINRYFIGIYLTCFCA